MLPFELRGSKGSKMTECAINEDEESALEWKVDLRSRERPGKQAFRIWKYFSSWLRHEKIETIMDFKNEFEWKWLLCQNETKCHTKTKTGVYNACIKDEQN